MTKNGLKIAEIYFWPSHIINNNICNILIFSNYSFTYLLDPVFRAIFNIFGKNEGNESTKQKKIEK